LTNTLTADENVLNDLKCVANNSVTTYFTAFGSEVGKKTNEESTFKAELRKRKDISQVPKHYEIEPRKLNIILTQLRCFASFLNYSLQNGIIISLPLRND
jgi:hypothetical protein